MKPLTIWQINEIIQKDLNDDDLELALDLWAIEWMRLGF